jgi:predicted DNA-binding ArsR family transcriptional regulator
VICSIFDSLVEKLADEGIVQELVLQPSQTVSYEIHPLLPIYLSKRLSSFDERPEVLYAIERGFVYYHYDRATESPTHILASIDHVKSYRLHKRELNSVLNAMWISWFELRPNSKSHYSEIRKRLGGKSGREKRFEENLCNIFKSAMNSENTVRDDTDKIENTHLRAVKGRITFVTQSLLWAMWSGVRTTDIELFAEVMLSKLLPLLSLSPEEFWNYNEYYFISFMATVFVAEMKRRHGELQVWRDWCRIILKIVVSSADYDVEILDGPNLLSIVGMAYVAIDETDEGEEVFEAIVKDGTASLEILLSSMYLLVAIAHRQGKRDVMAQRLQKLQQLMETSTAKHANATFILTVIQRMPFIPITGAISTSLSQDIRDAIFKKFDTVAPIVDAMKLKDQGKKEKAYELVYDALGAAVERKSLFRQITCYDTLCAMHYEDEDWEQATALAAKAQRLVEADPNSGSFEKPGGLRYFVQGHCHERLRDWDMAELNYQKTVERCLNAGEHALFAKAAVGLMTTKLSRGERID